MKINILLIILDLTLIVFFSCASTGDKSGAGKRAPRSAVQASAVGGTPLGSAREFGDSAYEEVGNSGLFSVHSAENSRIASRKKEEKAQPSINAAEIQGAVMSFADTFGAMVGQYATELEHKATSIQGRLNASRMKLFAIASALQIASGPYPGVALLDMIVLTTLNRIVWEEYWFPEVYGKQADSMVDALKKLEAEIWATAAKVLTSEQQKEFMELILEWRKKNPLKTEVNYVRFSDFGGLGRKPTLEKAIQPGGFLAPVKQAAQEAEQIRQLMERAVFLFSRQLLLVNYQGDLLFLDLLSKPEVQQLLVDTQDLKKTSERYAEILRQLPKQISHEGNMTIKGLLQGVEAERKAAVRQIFDGINQQSDIVIKKLMQEISIEREAAIKQGLEGVGYQREALVEQVMGKVTLERKAAIDQILKGLALERQNVRLDIGNLADHAFVIGAVLIIIFFLAMLCYWYVSRRIIGLGGRSKSDSLP